MSEGFSPFEVLRDIAQRVSIMDCHAFPFQSDAVQWTLQLKSMSFLHVVCEMNSLKPRDVQSSSRNFWAGDKVLVAKEAACGTTKWPSFTSNYVLFFNVTNGKHRGYKLVWSHKRKIWSRIHAIQIVPYISRELKYTELTVLLVPSSTFHSSKKGARDTESESVEDLEDEYSMNRIAENKF